MKKFAKFASFTMAALMATSGAAALADEAATTTDELGAIHRQSYGANLTELPIVEEPLTIQVWYGFSSTVMDSMNDCVAIQELEKRTGIAIDWVYPPVGSETDNFNLRCASNDLPHVFMRPSDYKGGIEKAVEDEIFLDYSKYYDEGMCPNLQYLRETYPEIARDTVTDSGAMIKWSMIDYVPSSPWSGLWVRDDMLADAGLAAPETIQDWDTMLRTFKEKYGTVLGLNINKWYGVKTNYAFAASYDTGYSWFAKDGTTVTFGPIQEGFRDFLTLLNGWYTDGLIDTDFATITYDDYTSKMADGTYGAFTSAYGEIGQAKVSGQNQNADYSLLAVSMPESYEGQTTHMRQTDSTVRVEYDVLTARCEEEGIADVVVKWKDYWYSQDGADLLSYGPEGVSYEWDDNDTLKWTYEDSGLIAKGGELDFWTVYPLFKLDNVGYLRDSTAYEMQPEVWQSIDCWGADDNSWVMPSMLAESAEETEELNRIMTDINTYVEEMTYKFITGQESMDNFDAFVENVNGMGIDDARQLKQDALDRYLAR